MHTLKALPVSRLSSILSIVAAGLRDRFGLTRLAIGGGSAPALLDHLFSGSALKMRDLDLILVADRVVERELAHRIGSALDSPELTFLPRYVYPRKRSRGGSELWIAGWGLVWDALGIEVDLSIFHDAAALEWNGLMNVDRILIPLAKAATFNELAGALLATGSASAAEAAGLIEDRRGGYASWVQRAPTIVAWSAIQSAPIECAIRIVRCCADKLRLEKLHPELEGPFRTAVLAGHERGDRFMRVRNLIKLLHDIRADIELEMMHALGAFEHWLPAIGQIIERLGPGGLRSILAEAEKKRRADARYDKTVASAGEQGGAEESALRLEALLRHLQAAEREELLAEIAVAEPTFASLVREQLTATESERGAHSL